MTEQPEQWYSIKDVADACGVVPKTVHQRIKEHPELGIQMVERRKTWLTARQASALAGMLSSQRKKPQNFAALASISSENPETAEDSQGIATKNTQNFASVAALNAEVAALKAQLAGKDEVIKAKDDEIQRLVEERKDERQALTIAYEQLGQAQKLLEGAQAEAKSYRPSIFGFWRKSK